MTDAALRAENPSIFERLRLQARGKPVPDDRLAPRFKRYFVFDWDRVNLSVVV